jgi:predicted Zn-ribbon and HTH transcriptional regulator
MFRKDLIPMLLDNPMTIGKIAHLVDEPPKDVEEHLKHLLQSLKHTEYVADIYPAECRRCDFVFGTDKLHKPSKCPKCKATWLTEPEIGFKRKGAQPKS